MKEELIKAIEEKRLGDFIIDNYDDMPMKTVKRLLILLTGYYFKEEDNEDLIEDITTYYRSDFE